MEKKSGWKDYFPYEPRLNQEQISGFVSDAFEKGKICIVEAPYGIGKTISMLSAALATGKKIIFCTCNNAAHHAIVDEVLTINKKLSKQLKVASIVGKDKLCLDNSFSYDYCDKLKIENSCKFNNRTYSHRKGEKNLSNQASLLIRDIENTVANHPYEILHSSFARFVKAKCLSAGLCPYEIMLALAKRADVVILDYFHIFTYIYKVTKKRLDLDPKETILFIDEADELKERLLSSVQKQLSLLGIMRLKEQAKKLSSITDSELALLDNLSKTFLEFLKKEGYSDLTQQGLISFFELNFGKFSEFKEKVSVIVKKVSEKVERTAKPDLFLEALENISSEQFCYGFRERLKAHFAIADYELPSSKLFETEQKVYTLKDVLSEFSSCILFSATIGDVQTFRQNLGIQADFFSSDQFNTEKFKVILKRDISSLYTKRKETSKKVIADIAFLKAMSDGIFIAFPSYESSFDIVPYISASNIDAVKEAKKGVYYVVLGGRGSRGINKASELNTVYIYGLQLPPKDDYLFNKRKDFLLKKYPKETAYKLLYSNVVNKACQTAGRIFRTRNKKGLVIFADSRYRYDFMQKDFFYSCFPSYFKKRITETLDDRTFKDIVSNFWGRLQLF